ncbi:MAG: CHAT domain-containing protein [Planctomycetota bacterium]
MIGRALLPVLLLACALPAQAALQEFQQRFVRAVRAADQPAADYGALLAELEQVDGLVDQLPANRQKQARFFVGVRKAEMHMRAGDLAFAGELGLEVREVAREARVYSGSYRAILLVILWQCVAPELFDEVLREEADFFAKGGEAERAPEYLRPAVELMRCQLRFRQDSEVLALRDLRALADRMILERPQSDPWRIKCLGELAWYYIERKDLARAEIYLSDLPADRGRYPRALIALRRGDFARALEVGKELSEEDDLYLHLVGEAQFYSGQLGSALQSYRDFEKAARTDLDRALALRGQADCLLGLGKREEDADKLAEADELCARGLELATGSTHAEVERCGLLTLRGHIALARDEFKAAYEHYEDALAALDEARRTTATDLFGGALFTADYMACVPGAARTHALAGRSLAHGFAALEVGKARAMLDWMGAGADSTGGQRKELLESVRRLSVATDLNQLNRDRLMLERARRPVAREGLSVLDAPAIDRLIADSPGHLFLSYWLAEEGCLLLWARGGNEERGMRWLGDRDTALQRLGALRRSLANPGSEPWTAVDAAAEFFFPKELHANLLWAERVVFCPDDLLSSLPFEAFRVGGKPLGRRLPVERAPSLTVWSILRERESGGENVLIVDSVRSSPELEEALGLQPLAFSSREAELTARAYGEVERLSAESASLQGLSESLQDNSLDLLHISAHAVQSSIVPTATLLLLADGATSLASLAELRTDGALVVLSSCSSALGVAQEGEGSLGILLWPFATGARGVLASISNGTQQATADLMGQFHHFRAAGSDPAEAMRRARDVLAAAENYAHPHYWAGFGVFAAGN